jgi:DnaJ-class molecular chaperone
MNNTDNYTLIKPGYKKVIPNMGITREEKTGNFIVHFEVEFPNTLDKTIREKLAEIL